MGRLGHTPEALAEMRDFTKALEKAGGPYIGPRGGKWADPQHTVPWKAGGASSGDTGGSGSSTTRHSGENNATFAERAIAESGKNGGWGIGTDDGNYCFNCAPFASPESDRVDFTHPEWCDNCGTNFHADLPAWRAKWSA